MSQVASLSEAEIEARFHVAGDRPVAFLLARLAKAREPFSVHFGADFFLTTLLAVQPDTKRLILDCSGSPELNQRFLAAERAVLVGRPGGVHVQFSIGRSQGLDYLGGKAFAVDLPARVVRLQRRESFRIETPRAKPLECVGRLPDGGLLKLPAHDLSLAGIGLTAQALPAALEPGTGLPNCHLLLPGDEREFFFAATVCHVTAREGRRDHREWRVGLQFNVLDAGDERRLQRYIVQVERERHERS